MSTRRVSTPISAAGPSESVSEETGQAVVKADPDLPGPGSTDPVSVSPSEYVRILKSVNTLRDQVDMLREENGLLSQALQEVKTRLAAVEASRIQSPAAADAVIESRQKFSGSDYTELKPFLSKLALIFLVQPESFPSDREKVLFAALLLEGSALRWAVPYIESGKIYSMSYADFKEELKRYFLPSNYKELVMTKLYNLKQTSSVSQYAVRFRILSRELDSLTDPVLCVWFERGLKPAVKDLVVANIMKHDSLDDLIDAAARYEMYLEERMLESEATTPVSTTTNLPRSSHGSQIADGVRQERIANNLCLNCGSPDHYRAHCPARPQSRPQSGNGPRRFN